MPDDIHAIHGLRKDEIERLVERVEARADRIEARVSSLEKMVCANGRPSLEDRDRGYALELTEKLRSEVMEHRKDIKRDFAEMDINVKYLVKENGVKLNELEEKQDQRHDSNVRRFGLLDNKLAYASGATAIVVVVANHFWK